MSLTAFLQKTKTIYYESLDELPIWNWDMLHKHNDFKYICKKGVPDKRAEEIYRELSYGFEKIEAPVMKAKRDVAVQVIHLILNILENTKDPKKLDEANTVLSAIAVAGAHSDWLFKLKFTETTEQRQMLSLLAVTVKKSEALQRNMSEASQTLNQKVVAIERILSIKLDPMKTSVNLFMEYERQAVETVKKYN